MGKDLPQFATTSSYNVFYSPTCPLHIYKLRKILYSPAKVLILKITLSGSVIFVIWQGRIYWF